MEKPIVNICIVHFNTPLLTECLIKSINKFTPNSKIFLFDNSNKLPFVYRQDNLVYYDNTKGQLINFDKWLQNYPNKTPRYWKANRCASAQHCYTIQKCIELIDDNFILLDSDVLLKRDITELFDENYIFAGELGNAHNSYLRVFPWLCYINVKKCKELGISYFNDKYMLGLNTTDDCDWYDTGAYFYEQCKNHQFKRISDNSYIVHLASASWNSTHGKAAQEKFLLENKNLYLENYKEKTIITMTSWKKRITNIPKVLDTIFKQTVLPDKIVINLSSEEFPGKEKSLPENVNKYIKTHELIEIHWVDGPNTKQWKKIIPSLKRFPKDAVICIDDDRMYDRNFIKQMVAMHKSNPNNPITLNVGYKLHGMIQHCGHGTLDKLEYYTGILDIVNENIMENPSSDTMFTYLCYRSGRKMISVDRGKMFKLCPLYNEIDPLNKSQKTGDLNIHERMIEKLNKQLNFDIQNITKSPYSMIISTRRTNVKSKNTSHQLERPNKVHIESSWNPMQAHPAKTVVKSSVPAKQIKNNNVIHIKRLFY